MVCTVIGMNSFLAAGLRKHVGDAQGWTFLSHTQALEQIEWIDSSSVVINFAFAPEMAAGGYKTALDIDIKLAHLIAAQSHIHYIMLSTRKVYGTFNTLISLKETDASAPDTPYGRAKSEVEQRLSDILPPSRLTILRPANIFGEELNRKTFFGYALTRLIREKKIVYDFNPHIKRDFLSVDQFSSYVAAIASKPKGGIYNVGAGFAVPCEKIADWLIEGYGQGTLEISHDEAKDAFCLDMTKTNSDYHTKAYTPQQLQADCTAIGRAYQVDIGSS